MRKERNSISPQEWGNNALTNQTSRTPEDCMKVSNKLSGMNTNWL